jgi:transcriptional regulator with XRE-family HTH domain
MKARGLNPQQLAAAARVHKGTLYRLIAGRTAEPHHSTMRKICKILELDIAELVGSEQLDLLDQRIEKSPGALILESLLASEISKFPEDQRGEAAATCLFALLEVKLGAGRGAHPTYYEEVRRADPAAYPSLVTSQLESIRPAFRLEAVRHALGALIDLSAALGDAPWLKVDAVDGLRNRRWTGVEAPKRSRIP